MLTGDAKRVALIDPSRRRAVSTRDRSVRSGGPIAPHGRIRRRVRHGVALLPVKQQVGGLLVAGWHCFGHGAATDLKGTTCSDEKMIENQRKNMIEKQ